MPDISDYPDAVERITRAHVSSDSTTDSEVRSDLRGADAPQITQEVADNLEESILTEDKILEGIDSSGEIPSEGEIDSMADVADQYDMADRQEAVSEAVSERVVTQEEIETALDNSDPDRTDEPVFREDIEDAIDNAAGDQEFRGADREEVVDESARDLGAPSRKQYDEAKALTIAESSDSSPSEVIDNPTEITGIAEPTANKAVPTIRDESGDIVAVSGANETVGNAMADELGVEYQSLGELEESMSLDQSSGDASVAIDGERVRNIQL